MTNSPLSSSRPGHRTPLSKAAAPVLEQLPRGSIHLGESVQLNRRRLATAYLRLLTDDNLLRPYRLQAGLWSWSGTAGTTVGATVADGPDTWHWGWEAPTSQLRGHILGHWLSGAAFLRAEDRVLAARSDDIIDALAACQEANGDGWIAPFGPEHLARITRGRPAWAPHYVVHKLLAGLADQYVQAGQTHAREILDHAAEWFLAFTAQFTREQLDDMLDHETGGMLEVWADMLDATGDARYETLIERYRRGRFLDALLAGEDVLTNKHANTQIPEILGCARAYDVTGDETWLHAVEAFWRCAVTERGTYPTGGISSAEIWQPPHDQSGRLHDVQEHCTVVNMMRLADWLHRRTGDVEYADFWERNQVNGLFAQQHPTTGMVSYFLPLAPGSTKVWGRPLEDFWCCHGTLLQAHTDQLGQGVHRRGASLRISQWTPCEIHEGPVCLRISQDGVRGLAPGLLHPTDGRAAIQHVTAASSTVTEPRAPGGDSPSWARPSATVHTIANLSTDEPVQLELRVPSWANSARVEIGEGHHGHLVASAPEDVGDTARATQPLLLITLSPGESARLTMEMELRAEPIAGDPSRIAFLHGPTVLAGLCREERRLAPSASATERDGQSSAELAASLLQPDHERTHSWWDAGRFRTRATDPGVVFLPLSEITDEPYTVAFLHGR